MIKKQSLLEQVKAVSLRVQKKHTTVHPDFSGVAIAWVNGEITTYQINKILKNKKSGSSIVYGIAIHLRDMVKDGKITIKKV